jgi:hypothetical protein
MYRQNIKIPEHSLNQVNNMQFYNPEITHNLDKKKAEWLRNLKYSSTTGHIR